MCKKQFFTVWILLSFFISISSGADFNQSRDDIITLIKSGQVDSAKSGIDNFIADFPQSPDLPVALCWIAEEYGYGGKRQEEKNLYQQIMKSYPDNPVANKAKLGFASAEVRTLIVSQDYQQAKEAIDKLIIDFNDSPDLPSVLCRLACGYEWSERYLDAKDVFEQIVDKSPDGSVLDKAKLGVYRTEICSIIASGQPKAAEADIIREIKEDFADNPDLPETFYRIARRYEWSDRYTEANDVYQQLLQNYPQSPFAGKAQLGSRRSQVRFLIVFAARKPHSRTQDSNNLPADALAKAAAAMEKLISDFNDNPDLPDALYWIAQRYGYSGKFEDEKSLYRRIIEDYPDNSFADKAKLDLAGAIVLDLVLADDNNDPNMSEISLVKADKSLEKFVADFNSNPYLIKAMLFMADKCHEKGVSRDPRREIIGSPANGRPFRFAANMLEKYVSGKAGGTDSQADAYRMVCEDYYRLGDGEKTAEYAELALQTDPRYRFSANMLWLAGTGYERMKAAGQIPAADADLIIEGTYQELMDKYPSSRIADWSALHLGMINYRQGSYVKGCAYFGWYLMNARASDWTDDPKRMEIIRKTVEGCRRHNNGK